MNEHFIICAASGSKGTFLHIFYIRKPAKKHHLQILEKNFGKSLDKSLLVWYYSLALE